MQALGRYKSETTAIDGRGYDGKPIVITNGKDKAKVIKTNEVYYSSETYFPASGKTVHIKRE